LFPVPPPSQAFARDALNVLRNGDRRMGIAALNPSDDLVVLKEPL
jgi:hypothetical protein